MSDYYNKKKREQWNERKSLNRFNSITEKEKPENQNQQHNVRKEGIAPINQKRQPDFQLSKKVFEKNRKKVKKVLAFCRCIVYNKPCCDIDSVEA